MRPSSERIDPRYSDPVAHPVPWAKAEARLAGSEVAWIVTVRPDGRPHATPMVPVSLEGRVYFHTGAPEVKYVNLESNPRVLVLAGDTAWDAGLDVVVEGVATPVTDTGLLQQIAALYHSRWDGRWQLEARDGGVVHSGTHDMKVVVFEVTPTKAFGHDKGDPFSQTNYRF